MIIFSNKKTGDIVGTVDGFGPDLGIFIGDPKEVEKTVIGLGHEHEALARELEDPRNPKQIFDYQFKGGVFKKKEKKDGSK